MLYLLHKNINDDDDDDDDTARQRFLECDTVVGVLFLLQSLNLHLGWVKSD